MIGRIYDPTLGRFLQADPFIQAPYNTQSSNRYSFNRLHLFPVCRMAKNPQ
jgi:hypothetical protein